MTSRRVVGCGVWVVAVLLAAGCGRKHLVDPPHNSVRDPFTTGSPAAPGKPGGLTAEGISGTSVTLRWTMADSSGVSSYTIYMQGPSDATYGRAGTSPIQRGTVSTLQTGALYLFKVAAVNAVGLEGPLSEPIALRPTVIAIVLNANADVTSNPNVSVQITAAGFNQIRLSGRTDSLATSAYQNLGGASVVGFTLSGADGSKRVFGQFRDSNSGSESAVVFDDIQLDRFAQIDSLGHDGGGLPRTAGDVIRFAIKSEKDGSASVDIGSARIGLKLYDDGTNGDDLAGDGRYKLAYTVEPSFDANSVPITGRFSDRAGNLAIAAVSPLLVTIRNPPPAVTLQSAIRQSAGKVLLQWSESGAGDFFSYRVWHAVGTPVMTSPGRILDTTITVRTTTTFAVTGLTAATLYGFAVEVVDNAGNATASNELTATASPYEAAEPATMEGVTAPGLERPTSAGRARAPSGSRGRAGP